MEQTELQKLRSKILSSLANEPIDATEKELGYSAAMADIIKIIDEHTNRKVKQTALEWFENELYRKLLIVDLDIEFNQILEQAKQIEKEQIVEAFYEGVDQESDTHGAMNLDRKDAENYYNETFKTK
jgi:hypothetical protein